VLLILEFVRSIMEQKIQMLYKRINWWHSKSL